MNDRRKGGWSRQSTYNLFALRLVADYKPFPGRCLGDLNAILATALYPPNAWDEVAAASIVAWTNSASSMHLGGLNVLMGDGSVRFIKDSIQTWSFNPASGNPIGASQNGQGAWVDLPPSGVWQALSTRSGGEVIGSDSY
jgi:prepilin-type processing-associated H-X9-DG protein